MGFNSGFKGLMKLKLCACQCDGHSGYSVVVGSAVLFGRQVAITEIETAGLTWSYLIFGTYQLNKRHQFPDVYTL